MGSALKRQLDHTDFDHLIAKRKKENQNPSVYPFEIPKNAKIRAFSYWVYTDPKSIGPVKRVWKRSNDPIIIKNCKSKNPLDDELRREYILLCYYFRQNQDTDLIPWTQVMLYETWNLKIPLENEQKSSTTLLVLRDFFELSFTLWWVDVVEGDNDDDDEDSYAPPFLDEENLDELLTYETKTEKKSLDAYSYLRNASFRSYAWFQRCSTLAHQTKNMHVTSMTLEDVNEDIKNPTASKVDTPIEKKHLDMCKEYLNQLGLLAPSFTEEDESWKLDVDYEMPYDICNEVHLVIPRSRIIRCVFDSKCREEKNNEKMVYCLMDRHVDLSQTAFYLSTDLRRILAQCPLMKEEARKQRFPEVMYVYIVQVGSFYEHKKKNPYDSDDDMKTVRDFRKKNTQNLHVDFLGRKTKILPTSGHASYLVVYPWTLQIGFFDPHGKNNSAMFKRICSFSKTGVYEAVENCFVHNIYFKGWYIIDKVFPRCFLFARRRKGLVCCRPLIHQSIQGAVQSLEDDLKPNERKSRQGMCVIVSFLPELVDRRFNFANIWFTSNILYSLFKTMNKYQREYSRRKMWELRCKLDSVPMEACMHAPICICECIKWTELLEHLGLFHNDENKLNTICGYTQSDVICQNQCVFLLISLGIRMKNTLINLLHPTYTVPLTHHSSEDM